MLWSGWGDPARATPLPAAAVELLRDLLGVRPPKVPPVALESIEVPPSRLPGAAADALAGVVGAGGLRTDAETRIRHTRGKSTPDLLRVRAGDVSDAPDAVVLPGTHEEVLGVLGVCAEHLVTVIPFGGGTSVVGGLAPPRAGSGSSRAGDRPRIALDLRRLDRLLAVDPLSRTATLQPGLRAPRAEELLREHGLTLGHYPQSYEWATVGGFAAARSSGQASTGYGRFDDMVVALTVATPEGTLELGRAPKSAAGPDLRQLVLGSEGAFGVITSVTVRVRPAPETAVYDGWRFPAFAEGTAALRTLAQDGPLPTVLRLADETETMVGLARAHESGGPAAGPEAGGCLAIVGFEGVAGDVASRRAAAGAVLRTFGGEPLGGGPGESWARGRFAAPYLRDALLDVGAFAETLETAAFWSGIPALYAAVREALTGSLAPAAGAGPHGTGHGAGRPLVMCHISHVYPAGASLYFTVLSAGGDDAVARWARAKGAVNDAIIAAGGTISHHHGVGTDHRDWYAREIGPLGVEVLRAVKDRLDPAGILNPGVLVPDHPPAPGR
ncbi:FAD-binding oxidoreductase [Actinomadura alba]|uniref:FAD-binding oxidoreductase n=1 Tax=Actinomadura alba TaxID=406431 RepID=A0ABR7LZT0_9ACTN|nr:FAD-binding oxidoreductase [Actinomadura alba]MBC6470304.1 FAD-binding oxidoreductase [Actinomadura alba]